MLLASAVLAAWCFALADALRRDFQYIQPWRHAVGALALYTFSGAALSGLVWLCIRLVEKLALKVSARRGERASRAARFGLYALLAMVAGAPTAFSTFSGEMISRSLAGRFGPYVLILGIAGAAVVAAFVVRWVLGRVQQGRWGIGGAFAVVAWAISGVLMYVDLTVYVSLYPMLHTALEVCAGLLDLAAFYAVLTAIEGRCGLPHKLLSRAGGTIVAFSLGVLLIRPVRTWLDDALRHVWLEEVYAGRVLRRWHTAEALLSNPFEWRGLSMSRVDRLRTRYKIKDASLAPSWREPLREPLEFADRIREIRGQRRDFNVIIYYVDTLRHDVALDPTIMPNVARFAERSLYFKNAYAPGSDTLRSLPGLTGGNYQWQVEHPNDLLAVARRSEFTSVLFIAQSANEFLTKLRPSFKFEKTISIADYSPTKTDVWGYGADGPTAPAIVDKALGFLKEQRGQRSLMWLFNFDQHNWRELDERYVQDAARKYRVPEAGTYNWRYRVVARAIDAEFGRFVSELERLGMLDQSIVLFVSDHGEGLGRDGFWVHSVFLWECLVRVPLLMRIPGVTPRLI
ncbi:MAG TPA: sulfatase-like hydrolase/transferase, partial [Polyangiaceae bacterium]|nr:sulfatase-like hydrolase/transferase [Polyangiaceae bacterium]